MSGREDSLGHHWSLARQGGRWKVCDPEGTPCFLLGVNHLGDGAPTGPERADYFAEAAANLQAWGYTNFGYGTPPDARVGFPYLADLQVTRTSHFLPTEDFGYDDLFDPAFVTAAEAQVEALCRWTAGDPHCIGYYWNDTPRWDLDLSRRLRGDDFVSALRRLPAEAPGKQAYANFLCHRYAGQSARLAEAYGVEDTDPQLLAAFDFRELDRAAPQVRADDEAFLGEIAGQLYRVLGSAFRRFAPGKLIFGERFKLHDHPEAVLEAARGWVDAISIQPGPSRGPFPGSGEDESVFPREALASVHERTGKPILICDHQISFPDPDYRATLWHAAPSEAEAWDAMQRYIQAAARESWIIGYQRCQYRSRACRCRKGLLKQGLCRVDGTAYPLTAQRATRLNQVQ